jgi:hypothetical protein
MRDIITVHLNSVTCSRWPLLTIGVGTIREERLEELVSTAPNKVQKVLQQEILVLVRHSLDIVHDISSIVLHQELRATSLEVRIRRKCGSTLDEGVVSSSRIRMRGGAGIVQGGEDPRRTALFD